MKPRRDPRQNPARPPRDPFGGPFVETVEAVGRHAIECRVYRNEVYEVHAREMDFPAAPGITHIAILRRDGAAADDWRHKQRIKNLVCGPEREAVEVYPAESRLVDTCNTMSLWVLPAGAPVPFGYPRRRVVDGGRWRATAQRPFEEGQKPADALPFNETIAESWAALLDARGVPR